MESAVGTQATGADKIMSLPDDITDAKLRLDEGTAGWSGAMSAANPTLDPKVNSLEAVAYHEAGHALIYYLLGYRLKRVTIEPHGPELGSTEVCPRFGRRIEVEGYQEDYGMDVLALAIVSGPLAESRLTGQVLARLGDTEALRWLLQKFSPWVEVRQAYKNFCLKQARRSLGRYWPCVTALAGALLEKRTLIGCSSAQRDKRRNRRNARSISPWSARLRICVEMGRSANRA